MKILGIIGDPIRHSLSPLMHNTAFQKMKLPYLYLAFRVSPRGLGAFLKKANKQGMSGLNVTIPHKEKVIRFLNWIEPSARRIGAVNTIVLKNGKLLGYNTDAVGYLRSLREDAGFQGRGKTALVLGAGGAARAVVAAMIVAGLKKIYISNRTLGHAKALVRDFQKQGTRLFTLSLTNKALEKIFPETDLLVNATSIGLKGTHFRNLPLECLKKSAFVSDLVYRPLMTPFLKEALKLKLKIHTGMGMLIYQGAESFRLWTGKKPKMAVMKKALLDALR